LKERYSVKLYSVALVIWFALVTFIATEIDRSIALRKQNSSTPFGKAQATSPAHVPATQTNPNPSTKVPLKQPKPATTHTGSLVSDPTRQIKEKFFNVREGPIWLAVTYTLQEWDNHPPLTSVSRRDGVIKSTYRYFNPDVEEIDKIAVKPNVGGAVWEKGRYRFNIFLKKVEKGTIVIIELQIEIYEGNRTGKWHVCRSRGLIEKSFFDKVETKLEKWIKEGKLLPPNLVF